MEAKDMILIGLGFGGLVAAAIVLTVFPKKEENYITTYAPSESRHVEYSNQDNRKLYSTVSNLSVVNVKGQDAGENPTVDRGDPATGAVKQDPTDNVSILENPFSMDEKDQLTPAVTGMRYDRRVPY